MEGYLRLGLLLIATVIVSLILWESWHRRRRQKLSEQAFRDMSADEVLGLEPCEPRMNFFPTTVVEDAVFTLDPAVEAEQQQQLVQEKKPAPVIEEKELKPLPPKKEKTQQELADTLMVIHVLAKPGQQFFAYDLLQAIASAGLQYGEMNIFHSYQTIGDNKITLFSLASATKPGHFDLDKMGDFACAGLTLFSHLDEVPEAEEAFNAMLCAAEQLAEDLDGDVYTDKRTLWTEASYYQYQQKALRYQLVEDEKIS